MRLLAALGLHCYTQDFSSYCKQGLHSSCVVQASHCSGFSFCKGQALEHGLSSCGA